MTDKNLSSGPEILSQTELETLLGLPILRLIATEDAEDDPMPT
jgi:hypothetical protein